MRLQRNSIVCCLLAFSLLIMIGCKKADEDETASTTTETETMDTTEAVSEVQAEAETMAVDTKEAVSEVPAEAKMMSAEELAKVVNIEKPVSEVQAEAETLSVENLKAVALKYKEAILSKEDLMKDLSAKIKEIPVTEALGEEAKSLKSDLTDLETTLASLKERFQVYCNVLKEKGGDLSGLEL